MDIHSETCASVTRPRFIRLPKPGQTCPVTGLTRSYMAALVLPTDANGHRPPVKSHSVKIFGNRGCRLVDFDSLCQFIERQQG